MSDEQVLDDGLARVQRNLYAVARDVAAIKNALNRLGKTEGSAAEELEAELYVFSRCRISIFKKFERMRP